MGDNDKAQDSGQKPEKKADSAGVTLSKLIPSSIDAPVG